MKYFLLLMAFVLLPVVAQDEKKTENEDTEAEKTTEKTKNPVVVMKTNHGEITLELFKEAAPETVKNFIELAEGKKEFTDISGEKATKPFYDGLTFHRVIEGFMIQGGCPKGDGTGDGGFKFKDEISAKALGLDKEKAIKDGVPNSKLSIYRQDQIRGLVLEPIYKKLEINSKETFEAKKEEFMKELEALDMETLYKNIGYEYNNKLKSHHMLKGYIAMANSGPNTNGTQFFINLSDNKYLDGKHTVFGKVIKGMDVVEKIGSVEVQGSKPVEKVVIESVRLKKD